MDFHGKEIGVLSLGRTSATGWANRGVAVGVGLKDFELKRRRAWWARTRALDGVCPSYSFTPYLGLP